MNYGSQWRQHRRAFHQQMNSEVVGRYEPIQLDGTRASLRNILESPQNLATHLKLYVHSVSVEQRLADSVLMMS